MTPNRLIIFAGLMVLPLWTRDASASLIINGSFESGFSGWTTAEQLGSEGSFFLQSGTTSPVTGTNAPAPPGGSFAAMTDAEGPGAHILYQDIFVPSGLTSAVLRFDLFINNQAGDFFTPDTLDFATAVLNQQARVDLLKATADPFSVDPSDVLLNAFQTQIGDAITSGYTTYTVDVGSLLTSVGGQTLRLRFAETDNVFIFQFGVDNVSLTTIPDGSQTPIPEPTSLTLFGLGSAAMTYVLARRRGAGRSHSQS